MRVGVLSDTHGLLRDPVPALFEGCEALIHAGDVGQERVLEQLRRVCRVVAVRGNVDRGYWTKDLPATACVELGGCLVYILHDVGRLDLDPRAAGVCVVVYGHSHQAAVETRDGVLYLNPGSAGPRRFSLPVTVAVLELGREDAQARIIEVPTEPGA